MRSYVSSMSAFYSEQLSHTQSSVKVAEIASLSVTLALQSEHGGSVRLLVTFNDKVPKLHVLGGCFGASVAQVEAQTSSAQAPLSDCSG